LEEYGVETGEGAWSSQDDGYDGEEEEGGEEEGPELGRWRQVDDGLVGIAEWELGDWARTGLPRYDHSRQGFNCGEEGGLTRGGVRMQS